MSQVVEDPHYEKNVYLHVATAKMRFDAIEQVAYEVELALPKGSVYGGKVQITFILKNLPTSELYLDFRGQKVGQYTINQKDVVPNFTGHHLQIPSELLVAGSNHIQVYIHNKYRKDGVGLHSFTDQQDGLQYLYTQFEADYCHFVFPCFDQPDLKAVWKFSALVEEDWCVISNEHEEANDARLDCLVKTVEQTNKVFGAESLVVQKPKSFIFRESDRYSTYLFAIVAGPFDFFERNSPDMPPMRIYARKTLIESVNHEEMFNVTQSGMVFYKDFFGIAYPFRKYDQVFVPEHNFGAMENVGCVTFNESYLCRGETPTLAKRLRFSITNLHELAHMWFGNLVTMKWWNDLWLNESFATFMSFLAMQYSPKLNYFHDTCWVTFQQYAFWGVSTDQLSSTHPICADIVSTDQAESLFDGISYGKGSAFLKQFYNLLGYETMKKGLHLYFNKHKWQNTTLPDFVGALEQAWKESGDQSLGPDFSLTRWCDEWLNSSGINILEPIISTENGWSLQIKQTQGLRGKNRQRKQKLNVALFNAQGHIHQINNVVISEKEEINQVDTSNLPQGFQVAAIYLNEGQHAYCKLRFDQQSIDWFTQNLSLVNSAEARCSIWRYFWMLVMDRQMSSLKYIEFVRKNLPTETVEQIVSLGLMNLSTLMSNYIPQELVKDNQKVLFETLVLLLQNEGNTGLPKDPIVDSLFSFLSNNEHMKQSLQWLEKSEISVNDKVLFTLQKSHKYTILAKLFKSRNFDFEFKMELLKKITGDDNSDIAINTRAKCMAGLPDAALKAKTWAEITDLNSKDSLYLKNAKIAGFYSWDQLDIISPYFDKYYEVLPVLNQGTTYKYMSSFFYTLLPTMQISDSHIVKLVALKNNTADSEHNFTKMLQDGIEVLIRCQQIREFAKL